MVSVDSYSFTGPVFYDGEKYDKLDVDDLMEEPLKGNYTGGWVASIQHHFLAAAAPACGSDYRVPGRRSRQPISTCSRRTVGHYRARRAP